jgi:hypothetical protein
MWIVSGTCSRSITGLLATDLFQLARYDNLGECIIADALIDR